jgi:hypothetical protein
MTNQTDNIDYKHLLKKYMQHIIDEEGVSYIRNYFRNTEIFTEEEWQTLKQIEEEEEIYD